MQMEDFTILLRKTVSLKIQCKAIKSTFYVFQIPLLQNEVSLLYLNVFPTCWKK